MILQPPYSPQHHYRPQEYPMPPVHATQPPAQGDTNGYSALWPTYQNVDNNRRHFHAVKMEQSGNIPPFQNMYRPQW
ncbi:hypothetical protein XELAEV_18001176mg [Xenopus laevis]|nr:hypothetical protein XELAEV_18001176mg [Xenopus laevis]